MITVDPDLPTFETIETPRLLLTPYRDEDTDDVFAFLGDPATMRYPETATDLNACRLRLWRHEAQRSTRGYAPWVVRRRDDKAIVGWGGLYDETWTTSPDRVP